MGEKHEKCPKCGVEACGGTSNFPSFEGMIACRDRQLAAMTERANRAEAERIEEIGATDEALAHRDARIDRLERDRDNLWAELLQVRKLIAAALGEQKLHGKIVDNSPALYREAEKARQP